MSETKPAEAAANKKSKLPMIVAVAVLLAGGGFFAMKSKEAGAPKKEVAKLGVIEEVDEFLVNLQGGQTYLRAKVALHFKEGFSAEDYKKVVSAVKDAINLTLCRQTLADVQTPEGKDRLKQQIGDAVNALLETPAPVAAKPSPEDNEEEAEEKTPAPKQASKPKPPAEGMVSSTGPVLKVYFTSFATQ